MIDPKIEKECRKILTYGMCLDMAQNAVSNINPNNKLSFRNINNTYRIVTENISKTKGRQCPC